MRVTLIPTSSKVPQQLQFVQGYTRRGNIGDAVVIFSCNSNCTDYTVKGLTLLLDEGGTWKATLVNAGFTGGMAAVLVDPGSAWLQAVMQSDPAPAPSLGSGVKEIAHFHVNGISVDYSGSNLEISNLPKSIQNDTSVNYYCFSYDTNEQFIFSSAGNNNSNANLPSPLPFMMMAVASKSATIPNLIAFPLPNDDFLFVDVQANISMQVNKGNVSGDSPLTQINFEAQVNGKAPGSIFALGMDKNYLIQCAGTMPNSPNGENATINLAANGNAPTQNYPWYAFGVAVNGYTPVLGQRFSPTDPMIAAAWFWCSSLNKKLGGYAQFPT